MKLDKLNDEQLDMLSRLGVVVNNDKKYSGDELHDILDILAMRINADGDRISREGNICEDVITIITTDPGWI